MSVRELFFELLLISLGQRESFSVVPDRRQWEALFETARKQALIGITSAAMDKLEGEQRAPLDIYLQWLLLTEQIAGKNRIFLDRQQTLYEELKRLGFRSCILKGQGNAAYYPEPMLRQSGDIDVWVEGNRDKVVESLRARHSVKDVFYHHSDVKFFDDVKVEVHFTPSWMNSPFSNKKLQNFYADSSDAQFSNYDKAMGCCIPTAEFALVHAFVHTFRHLFSEGVGLRQLMDCHFILSAVGPDGRKSASEKLGSLGLHKFSAAVMYVLQTVFDLEEELLLCKPDPEMGKMLLDDVLTSGNFGRYGVYFEKMSAGRTIYVRGWYKMKRLAGLSNFSKGETIWAPAFKFWQYLWRMKY